MKSSTVIGATALAAGASQANGFVISSGLSAHGTAAAVRPEFNTEHGVGCSCSSCSQRLHVSSCACPLCASSLVAGQLHVAGCRCGACSMRMQAHGASCGCADCSTRSSTSHDPFCRCAGCMGSAHPVSCTCPTCIGSRRRPSLTVLRTTAGGDDIPEHLPEAAVAFKQRLSEDADSITFADTMTAIDDSFIYTPKR